MNALQALKNSRSLKFIYGLNAFIIFLILTAYLLEIRLYQNRTDSNPYHLFISANFLSFQKEQYVLAFPPSLLVRNALHHEPVIKKIKGLPGDIIKVSQETVFLNETDMGKIEKPLNKNIQLSAIESQVIPKDFYYLGSDLLNQGFDSRYQEFGLIHAKNIRCQVWPIY